MGEIGIALGQLHSNKAPGDSSKSLVVVVVVLALWLTLQALSRQVLLLIKFLIKLVKFFNTVIYTGISPMEQERGAWYNTFLSLLIHVYNEYTTTIENVYNELFSRVISNRLAQKFENF